MSEGTVVEPEVPGEVTMGDVLDAVKELTKAVADVSENLDEMRKEYGLKKRAGIFDQKGVS